MALHKVQSYLLSHHMSLKVYDCYRPTSAVDDFVTWATNVTDTLTKAEFYPRMLMIHHFLHARYWSCIMYLHSSSSSWWWWWWIVEDKSELFEHGYIAYNSSHSRGSTIGTIPSQSINQSQSPMMQRDCCGWAQIWPSSHCHYKTSPCTLQVNRCMHVLHHVMFDGLIIWWILALVHSTPHTPYFISSPYHPISYDSMCYRIWLF